MSLFYFIRTFFFSNSTFSVDNSSLIFPHRLKQLLQARTGTFSRSALQKNNLFLHKEKQLEEVFFKPYSYIIHLSSQSRMLVKVQSYFPNLNIITYRPLLQSKIVIIFTSSNAFCLHSSTKIIQTFR